jgi:catechol 2,3-dioxygenase
MKPTVRIGPTRLGHLNLFVSDVEKSAAFYRDVCGFREVFREPGISMIFMSNGNTHHDLGLMEITSEERVGRDGHLQVKPGSGKTPGLNHLGFEMETEAALVDAYRRAKSGDVPVSRTTDHQIAHSMYMPELNGHTFEFYADVIENWQGFYANNEGELISGHWDPELVAPNTDSRITSNPALYRNPEAVLQARNVAYAGLPVRNLVESIKYYRDVLGLDAVMVDDQNKFAVVQGSANGGCDVCLVETDNFPATRMLFGGVNLHDGKPLKEALDLLDARSVPATIVGEETYACAIVLDPDQIPLVYSTCAAVDLMKRHGAAVIKEISRLWAAGTAEKASAQGPR